MQPYPFPTNPSDASLHLEYNGPATRFNAGWHWCQITWDLMTQCTGSENGSILPENSRQSTGCGQPIFEAPGARPIDQAGSGRVAARLLLETLIRWSARVWVKPYMVDHGCVWVLGVCVYMRLYIPKYGYTLLHPNMVTFCSPCTKK